MLADSAWTLAAEHFGTFLFGLFLGFVASNRFKLVKRNGESHGREGE